MISHVAGLLWGFVFLAGQQRDSLTRRCVHIVFPVLFPSRLLEC